MIETEAYIQHNLPDSYSSPEEELEIRGSRLGIGTLLGGPYLQSDYHADPDLLRQELRELATTQDRINMDLLTTYAQVDTRNFWEQRQKHQIPASNETPLPVEPLDPYHEWATDFQNWIETPLTGKSQQQKLEVLAHFGLNPDDPDTPLDEQLQTYYQTNNLFDNPHALETVKQTFFQMSTDDEGYVDVRELDELLATSDRFIANYGPHAKHAIREHIRTHANFRAHENIRDNFINSAPRLMAESLPPEYAEICSQLSKFAGNLHEPQSTEPAQPIQPGTSQEPSQVATEPPILEIITPEPSRQAVIVAPPPTPETGNPPENHPHATPFPLSDSNRDPSPRIIEFPPLPTGRGTPATVEEIIRDIPTQDLPPEEQKLEIQRLNEEDREHFEVYLENFHLARKHGDYKQADINLEKAKGCLSNIEARDPFGYWFILGQCWEKVEEKDKAINAYTQVLAVDPQDQVARHHRDLLQQDQHDSPLDKIIEIGQTIFKRPQSQEPPQDPSQESQQEAKLAQARRILDEFDPEAIPVTAAQADIIHALTNQRILTSFEDLTSEDTYSQNASLLAESQAKIQQLLALPGAQAINEQIQALERQLYHSDQQEHPATSLFHWAQNIDRAISQLRLNPIILDYPKNETSPSFASERVQRVLQPDADGYILSQNPGVISLEELITTISPHQEKTQLNFQQPDKKSLTFTYTFDHNQEEVFSDDGQKLINETDWWRNYLLFNGSSFAYLIPFTRHNLELLQKLDRQVQQNEQQTDRDSSDLLLEQLNQQYGVNFINDLTNKNIVGMQFNSTPDPNSRVNAYLPYYPIIPKTFQVSSVVT